MNTSEKKINSIDFDMVPDLVRSGAIFNCYIVNYNMSDIVLDYPLDKIIKFIDNKTHGDLDYDAYKGYIEDIDEDALGLEANDFLAEDETFLGFLIIETEDTILVDTVWTTEISNTIWDCFNAFAILAAVPKQKVCNSNSLKPTSLKPTSLEPKSSINTFFKFMSLS